MKPAIIIDLLSEAKHEDGNCTEILLKHGHALKIIIHSYNVFLDSETVQIIGHLVKSDTDFYPVTITLYLFDIITLYSYKDKKLYPF